MKTSDRIPLRREFSAPWCGLLLVLTVLVTLILLAAAYFVGRQPSGDPTYLRPLVLGIVVLILVGGPLSRVLGYVVDGREIVILRPGWINRYSLDGLVAVEVWNHRLFGGSIRLVGNGGFWAFTGLYWNSRLGRYRCFVNDPSRAVVLRWRGRSVMVSPDDPEAFIAAVRSASGLC